MRGARLMLVAGAASLVIARGDTGEAGAPDDAVVVRAMKDELARSFEKLRIESMAKPYYIAYVVDDVEEIRLQASYGAILERNHDRSRHAHVDLRVGEPSLDSSGGRNSFYGRDELLPIEEDYDGIRHELWLATDEEYKRAVESLEQKRAAREQRSASPDRIGDFSQEKPAKTTAPVPAEPLPAPAGAEKLVAALSGVLGEFPDIHEGRATLGITRRVRYFLSTEGTLSVDARTFVQLAIGARTQADDGMPLDHAVVHTAGDLAALPGEAELAAEVRRMAKELVAERAAPIVEDYDGPVLFEAPAAARLLRALLASGLSGTLPPEGAEGRRSGNDSDLARKLGRRILPRGFQVVDDPGLRQHEKREVLGGYAADDEGMPAQRVVLVDDGTLKTLLMSRSPRKGLDHSNGHGRGTAGVVRGHISNLVMSAKGGLPDAALRKRLLAAARKAGYPYALVVKSLGEPPFTRLRDRESFMAAARGGDTPVPAPVVLVKLTADGKEQVVRGASLGGLSYASLEKVLAAGRATAVFNHFDAEGAPGRMFSGATTAGAYAIPSAIVAPALLLEKVEVRRPKSALPKPPMIPRPALGAAPPPAKR